MGNGTTYSNGGRVWDLLLKAMLAILTAGVIGSLGFVINMRERVGIQAEQIRRIQQDLDALRVREERDIRDLKSCVRRLERGELCD